MSFDSANDKFTVSPSSVRHSKRLSGGLGVVSVTDSFTQTTSHQDCVPPAPRPTRTVFHRHHVPPGLCSTGTTSLQDCVPPAPRPTRTVPPAPRPTRTVPPAPRPTRTVFQRHHVPPGLFHWHHVPPGLFHRHHVHQDYVPPGRHPGWTTGCSEQ